MLPGHPKRERCCEHEQSWEVVGKYSVFLSRCTPHGPPKLMAQHQFQPTKQQPNARWNPRYLKAKPLSISTPAAARPQTLRVRRRTLHGHRSSPLPQPHDPPRRRVPARRSRHARWDARRTAPSPIPSGRRRHRRAFARLCPSCDGELYPRRPYIFVRPFAGDEHPQGVNIRGIKGRKPPQISLPRRGRYMNRSVCHHLLAQCKKLRELQRIHALAVVHGLHPHQQSVSCKIFRCYADFGRVADARKLFYEIPHPDLISFTSLMSLHLQLDHQREAISLFAHVVAAGHRPDGFAVVGALSASSGAGDQVVGRAVHGLIFRLGLDREVVVGNALVDMYSQCGKFESAVKVFDRMSLKDEVTWDSMLHGYIKCAGVDSALSFFDQVPVRSVVAWTALITGHVQGRQPVRALELFGRMVLEGHRPTHVTIVGVLSACADIGALDLGRVIHGYGSKCNASSNIIVSNALMDMYAKSGRIEMAFSVFQEVQSKDSFTWTTMISCCTVQGDGKKALELFQDMLRAGVVPNSVTFVSVLSACSHAGLIEEGRELFDIMRQIYKIDPLLEHYGCMIDLLGRGGLLEEAEALIADMNVEPDIVIWRSLLSACLVRGNDRLAEIAGKEIIKREPGDDGVYVLLWNMYASSNKWREAREMRQQMLTLKIFKKPGCSWIEIDGVVHEFLVEDKTHDARREIYETLEYITRQLKTHLRSSSWEQHGSSIFVDEEIIESYTAHLLHD